MVFAFDGDSTTTTLFDILDTVHKGYIELRCCFSVAVCKARREGNSGPIGKRLNDADARKNATRRDG